MGEGSAPKAPLVIEIDRENMRKDIEKLDIHIPQLTPRIYREYDKMFALDVTRFKHKKLNIIELSEQKKRNIVFRDLASEHATHTTELDKFVPDYHSVLGFFAHAIKDELRLVGGYDILYEKVKEFVKYALFGRQVDVDDRNIVRNLCEIEATRTIIETFKREINALTVADRGVVEIKKHIRASATRPFIVQEQEYFTPKKSIFNKIIGDSHFELLLASFFDECDDIVSYIKNYLAVHFTIDYKNADGDIKDYYPDFVVKISSREIYIVEAKGREDLDDVEKRKRLYQWCDDVNALQNHTRFTALYVKQADYEKYTPKNFVEMVRVFGE